jgi:Zn-dependent peptidase ImmA (M78 family)
MVRVRLTKLAEQTLKEVLLNEPPINFDLLYNNEKLSKTSFKKTNPIINELAKDLKISKVEYLRGVLFVPDKRVIVISDDYDKRNNLTFAHEFGHWKIPSHKELLYKCTQFDLSPKARAQMEREANFFASEISFMGNLFLELLQSSALSMGNIKELSDTFGMSIEATLRRAVELEIRPCALLSLNVHEEDEENFLSVRYPVYSQSFLKNIGIKFNPDQTFSRNHALAKIVTDSIPRFINSYQFVGRLGKDEGAVALKTEVWKNDWNIFALFQPE